MSGALVDWAVAARTKSGHGESGDQYAVFPDTSGVLIAVVDGLGHGKEEAVAAHAAIGEIQQHRGQPLDRLVDRCHERLRSCRGVVMTFAWFHETGGRMSWIGVGNVEGVLLRAGQRERSSLRDRREMLLLRPGVVGGQLPYLRVSSIDVAAGDVLVLATDGIDSRFAFAQETTAARVRSQKGSLRATAARTTMPWCWSPTTS